ncbi:MAG: DNA double-strand break repair nuclease NurA [Candidatus Diapherotrites archaeon]
MKLDSVIKEAVEFINSGEKNKKLVAEKLSPLKNAKMGEFSSNDLLEDNFVFPVERKPLNALIAGVDSGFVAKNLASLDLVLIRAVGAVFNYKEGKVTESNYHPNYFHFPMPHLSNSALEKHEANCSMSLKRLMEEIKCTKEVIEKFSPDFCFIDGSVVPQYADKPPKDSKVVNHYEKILADFQDLYSVAEKNNCSLIGCVEDSRGSRFRSIVQEEILTKKNLIEKEKLENMFDSSMLDYLLSERERTCTFTYTKSTGKHPILMDFDEKWSSSIYGFYLRPSSFDRVLRVEFIYSGKEITDYSNKIASVVNELSCMHREYAYPSILIEADMRAKLKPEEINIVFNKIMDKLGKNIKLRMRREKRPF